MNFQKELATAVELAHQAGEIALEVYHRDFGHAEKADRSPVTEADRKVNEFLVEALKKAFPGDMVVGEESDDEFDKLGDRVWFVDPIDGTSDFIQKNGEWSVMIGLAVEGRAVAGVVYEPAHRRTYYGASGMGATRIADGISERVRMKSTPPMRDAVCVTSRSHHDKLADKILLRLGVGKTFKHGSVGCKIARMIDGRAQIYLNTSGQCGMWDTCGPEAILREAGGELLDFNGRAISYRGESIDLDTPFIAIDVGLLPRALGVLADFADR